METMDKTYQVTFAGTHFVLISTPVTASGEDEAIDIATTMIEDYYQWKVGDMSHDITAEVVED